MKYLLYNITDEEMYDHFSYYTFMAVEANSPEDAKRQYALSEYRSLSVNRNEFRERCFMELDHLCQEDMRYDLFDTYKDSDLWIEIAENLGMGDDAKYEDMFLAKISDASLASFFITILMEQAQVLDNFYEI